MLDLVCGQMDFVCAECREHMPCGDPCPGGEIVTFHCTLPHGHDGRHGTDTRWTRMKAGQPG